MFNTDAKICAINSDYNGIVLKYTDGSLLKYTADYIEYTNKYGDVTTMDYKSFRYSQTERPTYDELYEHWLKTKD